MRKLALFASLLVTLFAVTACQETKDTNTPNPPPPQRTVPPNPNQPPADQR